MTNGVSAVDRRRTGFATAHGVGRSSVRGVAPVPPPVFGGLSPLSSLVSYFPAPARVPPHIARFAPYIQSSVRSRVSGACRESTFLSAAGPPVFYSFRRIDRNPRVCVWFAQQEIGFVGSSRLSRVVSHV